MHKDPLKIFQKSPQWSQVKKICQTLGAAGHTAWLAGGSVRDALLGVAPKDFDIATSATPDEVEKLFSKTVSVGKVFGVIKVVTPKGDFEVASFRKDGLYIDGRRPETVEFSTPEQDALRRDFTVNALFYDIENKKIHDFTGGLEDLKKKTLRTVGEPSRRFDEDKLRILRALRFISQLGFALDGQTWGAVRRLASQVNLVSGERLFAELTKFLNGKHLIKALPIYSESGLHQIIFDSPSPDMDLFKKNNKKGLTPLNWVLLLPTDVAIRKKAYERLKVSGEFEKTVESILNLSESLENFKKLSLATKKKLAAAPLIKEAMVLAKLKGAHYVLKYKKLPKAFVDGKLLSQYKVNPGPQFGALLRESFDAQLEGKIKNKKEANTWLKKKLL